MTTVVTTRALPVAAQTNKFGQAPSAESQRIRVTSVVTNTPEEYLYSGRHRDLRCVAISHFARYRATGIPESLMNLGDTNRAPFKSWTRVMNHLGWISMSPTSIQSRSGSDKNRLLYINCETNSLQDRDLGYFGPFIGVDDIPRHRFSDIELHTGTRQRVWTDPGVPRCLLSGY